MMSRSVAICSAKKEFMRDSSDYYGTNFGAYRYVNNTAESRKVCRIDYNKGAFQYLSDTTNTPKSKLTKKYKDKFKAKKE